MVIRHYVYCAILNPLLLDEVYSLYLLLARFVTKVASELLYGHTSSARRFIKLT